MTFLDPLFFLAWAVVLLLPPVLFLVVTGATRRAWWGRVRQLDRMWAWLGSGAQVYGSGREWAGEVDGRHVEVDWFDRSTTVYVEGHPRVKVSFGLADQPESLVVEAGERPTPLPFDDDHVAFAEDPSSVGGFVDNPRVQEALDTLLEHDGEDGLRAVHLDPDHGVSWFARNLPRDISSHDAKRWVQAMITLAEEAETVRLAA